MYYVAEKYRAMKRPLGPALRFAITVALLLAGFLYLLVNVVDLAYDASTFVIKLIP